MLRTSWFTRYTTFMLLYVSGWRQCWSWLQVKMWSGWNVVMFVWYDKADTMKDDHVQKGSNRAVFESCKHQHHRVCEGEFQFTHSSDSCNSTFRIARRLEWLSSMMHHELRNTSCALTLYTIDCDVQNKIEIRQDPIQRVSPRRFSCQCQPIVASLHLFAFQDVSLVAVTMTAICEDRVSSQILFWKQTFGCRWMVIAIVPNPILPRHASAMNLLSPLLKPWIFQVELEHLDTCFAEHQYATTVAQTGLFATCKVTVNDWTSCWRGNRWTHWGRCTK